MEKNLIEKEYDSLRTEILQWQNRRLTVYNISIAIILAYVGWLIAIDIPEAYLSNMLTWQLTSIFPLVIIGITLQMNRIFEFFMLKISSFLAVYHDSQWENENRKISVEREFLKLGLNNSYALIYLVIAIISVLVLIQKFPNKLISWESIPFLITVVFVFTMFILLYNFKFGDKKERLIKKWQELKDS